ncbi:MAG: hypothetical protein QXE81_01030 [Desulfurococcaceae archaeon]
MLIQRRPLVLAIYEPKWFLKAIEIAKRRGIKYVFYYSKESVPHGSVVYTDLELIMNDLSDREDLKLIYDTEKNCKKLEEAFQASMFIDQYNYLIVGIDVGRTISYVILGDNSLLLYGVGVLRDLIGDIDYVFNCVAFGQMSVKIGTGQEFIEILEVIRSRYKNIDIEIVDEAKTPPGLRLDDLIYMNMRLRGLKPHRDRDIYAAYRIALAKGVKVV